MIEVTQRFFSPSRSLMMEWRAVRTELMMPSLRMCCSTSDVM
jgi:hypothetical protein